MGKNNIEHFILKNKINKPLLSELTGIPLPTLKNKIYPQHDRWKLTDEERRKLHDVLNKMFSELHAIREK